jgi:hypothetical protein
MLNWLIQEICADCEATCHANSLQIFFYLPNLTNMSQNLVSLSQSKQTNRPAGAGQLAISLWEWRSFTKNLAANVVQLTGYSDRATVRYDIIEVDGRT